MKTTSKNELLKIKVTEFGPIQKGEVVLKPFTIFFGKNNTGKTYMAYLIWGITNSDWITHSFSTRKYYSFKSDALTRKLLEIYNKVTTKGNNEEIISDTINLNRISIGINKSMVSNLFQAKDIGLKRGGVNIRVNTKLVIVITIDKELKGKEILLDIAIKQEKFRKSNWESKGTFVFLEGAFAILWKRDAGYQLEIHIGKELTLDQNHIKAREFLSRIPQWVIEIITHDYLTNHIPTTLYLPASKAGIEQMILTAFGAWLKQTLGESSPTQRGIITLDKYLITTHKRTPQDILKLPKPLNNFLEWSSAMLLESPSETSDGRFKDIASFIENRLLRGNLIYHPVLGLRYAPQDNQNTLLSLLHSSSSVIENTPLLITLKYTDKVKPGTLLILEEPEAHLHPDAQRILARALVKLVNKGVYVLLITHSPYILQQINNSIKLYYLKRAGKEKELKEFLEKHDWGEDEILDPSKVAPYLFDDSEGYTKIRELEIIENEGISSEAFYHTIRELFNETYELVNLLESANNERAD